MDTRKTLNKDETFLELLQVLYHAREKVSMIIDENGMTRAEGFIKEINAAGEPPFVLLGNGKTISLKSIIAVNGTFLPDYSEC